VAGVQLDPIEKKPFFHVLPGEDALSFGMLGCDLHCAYCQNWITSQTLRDDEAQSPTRDLSPQDLVSLAKRHGSRLLVSTYNEPLITSEWAVEIFRGAKEEGLACAYVSNGNGTPEVLDYIRPWVDFYKVDLKGFDDKRYRELGGVLSRVLESIDGLKTRGFWVEIVTLIVPGFNDSDDELRGITSFLAGVDRDIPWHVTAFHPDYKMQDRDATTVASLERAHAIGTAEGLRYVYAGNRPGMVGNLESTRCPECEVMLVNRQGFQVLDNRLEDGRCPECSHKIAGVWTWPVLT